MTNPTEELERALLEALTDEESTMVDIVRKTLDMYGCEYSEFAILDMANYAHQIIEENGLVLKMGPADESRYINHGIRIGLNYAAKLTEMLAAERKGPRADVLLALGRTLQTAIGEEQINIIRENDAQ